MIALIDNYDSFTYNLYQAICELGERCRVFRNDAISVEGLTRLRPTKVIVSPGPGNPDGAGISLDLIRKLGPKLPILGICLGHQAIGQTYGGHVTQAPRPVHGKQATILHRGTGLFRNMPHPLRAVRYHSLIVERATLPRSLRVTAWTEDGLIMGLEHRVHPVQGVQFHPESVFTENGKQLIANFLEIDI